MNRKCDYSLSKWGMENFFNLEYKVSSMLDKEFIEGLITLFSHILNFRHLGDVFSWSLANRLMITCIYFVLDGICEIQVIYGSREQVYIFTIYISNLFFYVRVSNFWYKCLSFMRLGFDPAIGITTVSKISKINNNLMK